MVKGQKADFLVDLGGTPSTQLRKTSLEEPDLNECRLSLKGVCTEYMSRLEVNSRKAYNMSQTDRKTRVFSAAEQSPTDNEYLCPICPAA